MKSLGLLLFIILTQSCFAQFKVTRLDKHSLSKNIQYNGNILQAVRWTDTTSDNIVILTATDKARSKGPVGCKEKWRELQSFTGPETEPISNPKPYIKLHFQKTYGSFMASSLTKRGAGRSKKLRMIGKRTHALPVRVGQRRLEICSPR